MDNKYFAFISYKREDEEWAIWLQHELEYYHLPSTLNGRADLPKQFRPVFRDVDELKAGNLPEQIFNALSSSSNLIIVCSPNAAKSKWVNKEINDFIEIGKNRGVDNVSRIFPFIVAGTPHSKDKDSECFPQALRELPDTKERIGGNVNESGRDKAFIKVLSGMLTNVDFDMMWNRYEQEKAENERKEREKRDKLFLSQSRLIGEKAKSIAYDDSYLARLLALEVLPKDLEDPDRPYAVEAEQTLRQACRSNNAVFRGHTDTVRTAFFSHDDKMLVSASNDQTIKIWNRYTGQEIRTLKGHTAAVTYASFNPDSSRVVSSSDDATVRIWSTQTGDELLTIKGHKAGVNSVVFSPSGQQILSASQDGTAILWNAATGAIEHELLGHKGPVNSAIFSFDGSLIATASDDKTVKIWDAQTGKEDKTLTGFLVPVTCAVFSHDGNFVYGCCSRYYENEMFSVIGWKIATGEITIKGGKGVPCSHIYASRNQPKYILSNLSCSIYDSSFSGNPWTLFDNNRPSNNLTYASFSSEDDAVSASEDYTLRTWDLPKNSKKIGPNSYEAIVSPDQKQVLLAPFGDNTESLDPNEKSQIRLWDITTEKELLFHKAISNVKTPACFSRDNKLIAFTSSDDDATIVLYDNVKETEIRRIHGHTSCITSLSFSSNGEHLVSSDINHNNKVWETQTGRELLSMAGGDIAIFSPNDKTIASFDSLGSTNNIYLWDSKNGTLTKTLAGHKSTVNSINFSHDSKLLVSCSWDRSIKTWDVLSGENISTYPANSDLVTYAEFSPNGKYILSLPMFGYEEKVWDAKTGNLVLNLTRVGNPSLTRDGIPNMTAFKQVHFSPEGDQIFAISSEGEVFTIDFPPLQDLIDQTRERFKARPLTDDERRQYYLD